MERAAWTNALLLKRMLWQLVKGKEQCMDHSSMLKVLDPQGIGLKHPALRVRPYFRVVPKPLYHIE